MGLLIYWPYSLSCRHHPPSCTRRWTLLFRLIWPGRDRNLPAANIPKSELPGSREFSSSLNQFTKLFEFGFVSIWNLELGFRCSQLRFPLSDFCFPLLPKEEEKDNRMASSDKVSSPEVEVRAFFRPTPPFFFFGPSPRFRRLSPRFRRRRRHTFIRFWLGWIRAVGSFPDTILILWVARAVELFFFFFVSASWLVFNCLWFQNGVSQGCETMWTTKFTSF